MCVLNWLHKRKRTPKTLVTIEAHASDWFKAIQHPRGYMDLKPVLVVLLFSTSMLAGCFGEDTREELVEGDTDVYPEPWDRAGLTYDDSDIYARVSVNGTYAIDAVRSVYVPVPTITAADGGAGLTGDATVHLGLWLPVIEGCDWESESLDASCQVPVIAEVGPYYNDGDVDALPLPTASGRCSLRTTFLMATASLKSPFSGPVNPTTAWT